VHLAAAKTAWTVALIGTARRFRIDRDPLTPLAASSALSQRDGSLKQTSNRLLDGGSMQSYQKKHLAVGRKTKEWPPAETITGREQTGYEKQQGTPSPTDIPDEA
jgi:hypothetical protein